MRRTTGRLTQATGISSAREKPAAMHKLPEPILQAIESGKLPSPPQVLVRLLQLVDDEQSTIDDLATLVKQDSGLVTRMLGVANSPALRRGSELRSVENCLQALGTRLVRAIATCLSIQQVFDRRPGMARIVLDAFWGHALTVAELSRSLAIVSGHAHPDEAYLAGLLHDVGQLTLLSALGAPYQRLLAGCASEDELPATEMAQFGTHHGEIGAWLTDNWQLDSSFADGILFHHASAEEILTAAATPQLVWLAHTLTTCAEIDPKLDELHRRMFPNALSPDFPALRNEAEEKMRQVAEALGFVPPTEFFPQWPWQGLIAPEEPRKNAEDDDDSELTAMIGSMALLQPLQQDLFMLESDAEILLSLKESARILFELSRVAILFSDPATGKLSGGSVGDQPALFRQVEIQPGALKSLPALAASTGRIVSSFDADAPNPPALIDQQFARALRAPGLLCIPMRARQRTTGVMVCGFSPSQHQRLVRRLPWLINFGRIAAISLEALREAKQFREQAEAEASNRYFRQARRVIHEAGNPLGIIKSYLRILDHKLPEETGVRQELEILREEIDRVADIVGRMSEIPADQASPGGLAVAELIQEMLLLYGDSLFQARGIKVDVTPSPEKLLAQCDRDSLKQILLNLWKNASEALSAGQQIRISLTDHVVHNGRAYIQVRTDDNGPGMSDEAMRSIHVPSETRGNTARGMGLSIVGTLADRQGIPITCLSRAGKGTSVALLLPKFESIPSAQSHAAASPAGVTE